MEKDFYSPAFLHPAQWWQAVEAGAPSAGAILCTLCPHRCVLEEAQPGRCLERQNVGGQMRLTDYGRSSGFYLEPIEKKPLYHFYPGSLALSFGTRACNLQCTFCPRACHGFAQGAALDANAPAAIHTDANFIASPEGIARAALAYGAQTVAFTYNDPVVFAEYAIDTAAACRQLGIKTAAVTAAYIEDAAAREFFAWMDAAHISLKAFSDDFYRQYCGARLQPVLNALQHIRHHSACWLEIGFVLIPGHNDSPVEIYALGQWIARELGVDVPLHFSLVNSDLASQEAHPNSLNTLIRAQQIARECGLQHVYTGQMQGSEGNTSFCADCQAVLVEREGEKLRSQLSPNGHCPHCQRPFSGRFGLPRKQAGITRFPVYTIRRR